MNWLSDRRVITRVLLPLLLVLAAHTGAEAQGCQVYTFGSVNFGNYDPNLTGNLDASSWLLFRCNNTPNVIVSVDGGTSGSYSPRYMQGPIDPLGQSVGPGNYRDTVVVTVEW